MSMSDHERALLVTGTLDTSGVGGSPYANLDRVAVAFGAPVVEAAPEEPEVVEAEVKAAENSSPEPVVESVTEPVVEPEPVKEPEPVEEPEVKPAARKRTTAAKKAQASKPADE